jgi:hypothetical protein
MPSPSPAFGHCSWHTRCVRSRPSQFFVNAWELGLATIGGDHYSWNSGIWIRALSRKAAPGTAVTALAGGHSAYLREGRVSENLKRPSNAVDSQQKP